MDIEELDIKYTRIITGPLAVFDTFLGLFALLMPLSYMALMHSPSATGGYFMLQRTGMIWLFFAATQWIAFCYPKRLSIFIPFVGLLRIMDVPADIVYYLTTSHTFYGEMIILAPVLNAIVGGSLIYFWMNRDKTKVDDFSTQ